MSKLVKLNESALLAAGLPRDFVETMRHLVRQAGAITFDTTLPEVASMTDSLTPVVAGLTITLNATNQSVAALEADSAEPKYIDTSVARRLDELQAELERANSDRAALARALSEIRDEMAMNERVEPTRASLGAAALAGSSTQAFTTAALTASGLFDISAAGAGQIKFSSTQNASADANTLDDYEEGTWTATLVTTGTQPTTPPTSTCRYTKVGRLVTVQIGFAGFTVAGATGNISLTGLPFACALAPATGACWTWLMGATPMVARIDTSTSKVVLCTQTDDNGIPVTNGAGQHLYVTASYIA